MKLTLGLNCFLMPASYIDAIVIVVDVGLDSWVKSKYMSSPLGLGRRRATYLEMVACWE
jgi:hypothetical protein